MNRYLAEFLGAATLILVGCGSVVLGGLGAAQPLGSLAIALSFGLVLTGLIYATGPISGCHINPAVTLAAWTARRIPGLEVPKYVASQLVGGLAGAGVLYLIVVNGHSDADVGSVGLGQNGWGSGYLGEYSVTSAFIAEAVATFLFVAVILAATDDENGSLNAGIAIGFTLSALISKRCVGHTVQT